MTAIYCPHCGASSDKNTIQCNEEYKEFSLFSCYNCGKTHIREVKPELLILVRKGQDKPVDETAIRVKALCKYVMSRIAYEQCEQEIKELRGGSTPLNLILKEILKDDELDAAFRRLEVMKAELSKREGL
jgi:hypothetical protein